MSELHQDEEFTAQPGPIPRWVGLAFAILAAMSLLAMGIAWNAASQAKNAGQTVRAALKQNLDQLNDHLAKVDEVNQQLQSDLKVVTDKLQITGEQLAVARRQTKSATAEYNKKLTSLETSVNSELSTKASADDVKNLSADVTGVKNDLDATKGNLQMARSEMGTLIARNHEEIEELRRLGQRDYIEFTLTRSKAPQKVGPIQLQLRGTDVKRNRFTVFVLADDKTFEKKDRSVNEPIFFYTGGSRAAIELTINKVAKNEAAGYLSMPKAAMQQTSSTAGSGS
jgi:uncharacterized coiled-coil protein SlyX